MSDEELYEIARDLKEVCESCKKKDCKNCPLGKELARHPLKRR